MAQGNATMAGGGGVQATIEVEEVLSVPSNFSKAAAENGNTNSHGTANETVRADTVGEEEPSDLQLNAGNTSDEFSHCMNSLERILNMLI